MGKICNTITCLTCKTEKKRYEEFLNLQLEVKNKHTLFESFESLIQTEKIQDYFCDVCNQKRDISKRVAISECPNYLILHLKRIIFDLETMENVKINTEFEFYQVKF